MIKFNFLASEELLTAFDLKVVKPTQAQMKSYIITLPEENQKKFEDFFGDDKIKELLTCQPEALPDYITEIYEKFPLLADRYWPAFLLKDIPIPKNVKNFSIKTKEDKRHLDIIFNETTAAITAIATLETVFLTHLLNRLTSALNHKEKRQILATIKTIQEGRNRANNSFLDIFPPWINAFESIFNYSALSANIGHDIIDEWKIDVCLYCNNEPIQTLGKRKKIRTDLDHFYPQTKFPFLAVTLSNLIPSGKVCNQSYKKSNDMLSYAHPFILGVDRPRVFHLAYNIGEPIEEDNFEVKIIKQNNKIDINLDGFEIEHNYNNSNELKSWVANAFTTVETIVGLNEPSIVANLLNGLLNIRKPAHNERYKKFKTDSINQLANKELISFL